MKSKDIILPRIEDIQRYSTREFCDNFDEILELIDKEKRPVVIQSKKNDYVLCPLSLFDFMRENEPESLDAGNNLKPEKNERTS